MGRVQTLEASISLVIDIVKALQSISKLGLMLEVLLSCLTTGLSGGSPCLSGGRGALGEIHACLFDLP